MKVKELMEILKNLDPNKEIVLDNPREDGWEDIQRISEVAFYDYNAELHKGYLIEWEE